MDVVGLMWTGIYSYVPPPQWAMDPAYPDNRGYRWIPRIDSWDAFMAALVDRYGDRISAWEILNEPYSNLLGDGEAYGRMLKSAAKVIRERQTDSRIICGCLMGRTGPKQRQFEDDWFRVAGPESFDIVGVHYVSRGRWAEYVATMKAWGIHKPVWDTEGSLPVSLDPYSLAEELIRYYVTKLVLGVSRMSMHEWLRQMTWPDDSFAVSPTMAAHRTLAHRLNYAQYVAQLAVARDVECYAFKQYDGETILVMWNAACVGSVERAPDGNIVGGMPMALPPFTREVTLPARDAQPVLIDIMDNETPLEFDGGVVHVVVEPCPVFVRGIPLQAVEQLATISPDAVHVIACPGKAVAGAATIRNLTEKPMNADMIVTLPMSWAVTAKPKRVSISPGETTSANYAFHVPDDTVPGRYDLALHLGQAVAHVQVLVTTEPLLSNLLTKTTSAKPADAFISPTVDVFPGEKYFLGADVRCASPVELVAVFTGKDGQPLPSVTVDRFDGKGGQGVLGGMTVAPEEAAYLALRATASAPMQLSGVRIQLLPDTKVRPARLRNWATCAKAANGTSEILINRADQTRGHHQSGAAVDAPFGWQGPQDLSAAVKLSYDADALHIDVAVRDDSILCRREHPTLGVLVQPVL